MPVRLAKKSCGVTGCTPGLYRKSGAFPGHSVATSRAQGVHGNTGPGHHETAFSDGMTLIRSLTTVVRAESRINAT
jgi:hypothetical protein